jgi:rare lipoprotein A
MGNHPVSDVLLLRAGPVLLFISMLPACSVMSKKIDRAPSQPVDVSAIQDAVPRNEPRSRYGNPDSYVVNGKKYYVRKDSAGFQERGIASWYGTKFHGRRTSSGETYDMYAMTAAHKTLPLPTYVSVRSLDTGDSIVVKVNDRGPFHENRIIDLSYVAALKLGIAKAGTGLVEVRAIDPGNYRPGPVPVRLPTSAVDKGFYIQVGAFANLNNAQKLKRRLQGLADNLLEISEAGSRSSKLYRVRFGPITDINMADRIVTRLVKFGVTEHHIVLDL